jgi:hypothetical protein
LKKTTVKPGKKRAEKQDIFITNPGGGLIKARFKMVVVLKPIEDVPQVGYYNKHLALLEGMPDTEYIISRMIYEEPPLLALSVRLGSHSAETVLPALHVVYVRNK